MLFGGRIALTIAIVGIGVSLSLGLVLGILAGYGPRWLDSVLLLVMDAVRSFPTVIMAMAVVALTGPSLEIVLVIIIVTSIPSYARLARTSTLALKNAEFIAAERSLGATPVADHAAPRHAQHRRPFADPGGHGRAGRCHGRGRAELSRPGRSAADGELGHAS